MTFSHKFNIFASATMNNEHLNSSSRRIFSLQELTTSIAQVLHARFNTGVWIVGEVSECKVGGSGHCYLSLVERKEGAAAPVAEIRAAIWARQYREIASRFYATTREHITSGMKLLMYCSISFHSVYGLSLVINDIDATYTIGESELLKRQTLERLTREGVIALQKEQNALPYVVQKLAIVSSATAAGYEDFYKQIENAPYNFSLTLFEAMMQGDKTTESIIAALERILTSGEQFDAVVIIRGGGSASDLRWFDSYELCYYISQYPIAILTGIGHEKDTSVADMVAYHYFKTPTAVAAGLIDRIGVVDNKLATLSDQIEHTSSQILSDEWRRITLAAQELRASALSTISRHEITLQKLRGDIPALFNSTIVRETSRVERLRTTSAQHSQYIITSNEKRVNIAAQNLKVSTLNILNSNALRLEKMKVGIPSLCGNVINREVSAVNSLQNRLLQGSQFAITRNDNLIKNITQTLHSSTLQNIAQRSNHLQRLSATLLPTASGAMERNTSKLEYLKMKFLQLSTALLQRESSRLDLLSERIASHNPRRILSLGYSLAIDDRGNIIKSIEGLNVGTQLTIELSDGTINTNINTIIKK